MSEENKTDAPQEGASDKGSSNHKSAASQEPTSDPKQYSYEELARLKSGDIISFLNAKLKDHKCPACHTNHWEVVGGDGNVLGLTFIDPLNPVLQFPPNMIPLVVTICGNCGFTREHAAVLIARWRDEQKEVKDE